MGACYKLNFTCLPIYDSLILAYLLQSSSKCTSDSTDPGQKGQHLSFLGILGLLYLPVSITKLCELKQKFVKKDRLYLVILNEVYLL